MDTIGYMAAFCTTFAFLPQAIKVIQTRDTSSISTLMYLVFTAGVLLWLVYGILLSNFAIIVSNLITFILALVILSIVLYNNFKMEGRK